MLSDRLSDGSSAYDADGNCKLRGGERSGAEIVVPTRMRWELSKEAEETIEKTRKVNISPYFFAQ